MFCDFRKSLWTCFSWVQTIKVTSQKNNSDLNLFPTTSIYTNIVSLVFFEWYGVHYQTVPRDSRSHFGFEYPNDTFGILFFCTWRKGTYMEEPENVCHTCDMYIWWAYFQVSCQLLRLQNEVKLEQSMTAKTSAPFTTRNAMYLFVIFFSQGTLDLFASSSKACQWNCRLMEL